MRFFKRETDLEHGLRAQRPQPREEFVRTLASRIEPQRPRRSLAPKLAFVAAVTAALAASLGAAGALGSARGSVSSLATSVSHLVTPAKVTFTAATPQRSSANQHSTSTENTAKPASEPQPDENGNTDYGNATPTHFPPFNHQYGIRIPICWQGHIIYVSPREIVWYIFHGARPARFCHR